MPFTKRSIKHFTINLDEIHEYAYSKIQLTNGTAIIQYMKCWSTTIHQYNRFMFTQSLFFFVKMISINFTLETKHKKNGQIPDLKIKMQMY